ncbi:YqhV family protein [Tepidibacillus infernus]|uniref:YqhV family protein n=1 Tax=Tepidibacillus infernus TaxID=1806172 RepID=UPI003B701A3C
MELLNKFVLSMALLRFISGSLEILAGLTMLKLNDLNKALVVNSLLALVGPTVLILTTSIGLFGISDKISFSKFFWIFFGIGFILIGVRK